MIALIPIAVSQGDPIKANDWIGFAGNIVGGAMTIIAAIAAWLAVQKQILAQQKIAEEQISSQRISILQDRLFVLEEDWRLTWKIHRAASVIGKIASITITGQFTTIDECEFADSKFVELGNKIARVVKDLWTVDFRTPMMDEQYKRDLIGMPSDHDDKWNLRKNKPFELKGTLT